MKLKILVSIIVIVLLAAGGYYWWVNYRQAPAEENSNPPASGEVSDTSETPPGETVDVTVTSDEYSFSPATITVKNGVTVRLTLKNTGNVSHNFLIDALDVDSGLVSPGSSKTFEFSADGAGTYSFYCSVPGHEDSGMVGTLEVE